MTLKICAGCKNETNSTKKCKRCVELSLKPSYFCSQNCFSLNYKNHTILHSINNKPEYTYGEESLKSYVESDISTWVKDFRTAVFVKYNYNFTGLIRPWPMSIIKTVPESIDYPDYVKTGKSILEQKSRSEPIKIYNNHEIDDIRTACVLGRKVLDFAHSLVKVGVTSDYVDEKVHNYIINNNAYPSPLGYYGFPKSCCISINEVVCHGIPDYRPFKDGDIVNIDISIYYNKYHADLNETYFVGTVTDTNKKLVKCAHDCLMEAIKICKPNTPYSMIGDVIETFVKKQGFSVVTSYTGHGIGTLFHTKPFIYHYGNNNAKGYMKKGHVFTIEPMINEGTYNDELWPDQWTSVTCDGKNSAQFEHQIVITEDGCEILTKRFTDSPALNFD